MALLKAEHISKSYGEKHVLQDINIHLDQGELVSLLGVSGSGKTTLFHILSGLVTPDLEVSAICSRKTFFCRIKK